MDFKEMIAGLKAGSHDWKNFSPNTSALGYDADMMNLCNYLGMDGMTALGFDADIMNYGGTSGGAPSAMDQKALSAWLNQQVASGAMTNFKLQMYYTPGPGPGHENVNIIMFDMSFNNGVFAPNGDLVFTNAVGDTATIHGLTERTPGVLTTIKQLFSLTETEPFTIGFVRLRPKTVDQLDFAFSIVRESQYGASKTNSMAPDDYVDPYQFQLLRVDVPFNAHASKKHGFAWTIDQDQTGKGVTMTLFIPKTIDNTKTLDDKDMVRQLNNGNNPAFFVPNVASGIRSLAMDPQVKGILASGLPASVGVNLIKNLQRK